MVPRIGLCVAETPFLSSARALDVDVSMIVETRLAARTQALQLQIVPKLQTDQNEQNLSLSSRVENQVAKCQKLEGGLLCKVCKLLESFFSDFTILELEEITSRLLSWMFQQLSMMGSASVALTALARTAPVAIKEYV
ncbi:hypothetical protein JHK82_016338 [Glycine max]|nr:hypothetical protein JHK82_016338 [Glycine max]